MPGASSSQASSGGVSQEGDSSNNQPGPETDPELKAGAEGDSRSQNVGLDSDAKERLFREDPWFSKLPPELREAIRSRTRTRPPKGYEERLRRYFESIE
jgi:hypothetical protein